MFVLSKMFENLILSVIDSQSVDNAPPFPPSWKDTAAGKAMLRALSNRGFASWKAIPFKVRSQMSAAFPEVEALLSASPKPPSPSDARGPLVASLRRTDFLAQAVYFPVAFTPDAAPLKPPADVVKAALVGDVVHGADIRLVFITLNLEGPAKNEWMSYYASARHQATYLCHLLATPVPQSDNQMHNASTWMEKFYLDRKFRRNYLEFVFGKEMTRVVLTTTKEIFT